MAEQKHLISVLIPTYNAPEYFKIALDSARAQDYEPMEIIVCDNSTDDRTEQMMQAAPYADDPRITYVRNREAKTKEENFAPFEQLIHGDYVQWLMHDDVLLPGKLRKMAAILDTMPGVTLVTSQRNVIDAEGRPFDLWIQTKLDIRGEYQIFKGRTFGSNMLRSIGNWIGEPSAVLFRRAELAHPYYHAESRGYLRISDVAMWLELMEQGDLCMFRDPLSSFRCHEAQEGQQPDVILENRLEWARLIRDYAVRGIFLETKEEVREALENLLWDYDDMRADGWFLQHTFSGGMKQAYRDLIAGLRKELGKGRSADGCITSCLIYRNEAPWIDAWLAAADVYTDAYILINTGATDGTDAKVRAFAGKTMADTKLFDVAWNGDFAAMRNGALQFIRTEWVVFLDADETFEAPEKVRETLAHMHGDVEGVHVPIVNVDEDAGGQEISRFPALRIWRAAENRRYEGRIHEALVEDGKPLKKTAEAPELIVRHTGYSTRRLRGKLERNRAMLEQALHDPTEDERRLWRYLADCCYGLQDYARALDYAVKAIEQEPPTVAGRQPLYVLVLASMKGLGRPVEERLAFARAARKEHPDWLDMTAAVGLLAAETGAAAEAIAALTSFLRALDAKDANASMQSTGAKARRPECCRALARLYLQAGDFAGAGRILEDTLQRSRYDEAALTLWERVCRSEGKAFLASLSAFYGESEEEKSFLSGWVVHEGQATYRAALAPGLEDVSEKEAVKDGTQEMQALFRALYLGGRELYDKNPMTFEQSAALLPDGMQHILARNAGLGQPGAALGSEDADAYLAGVDTMCLARDPAVLERYAALSTVFGNEIVCRTAEKLCARGEWALAFALYQQVPENEIGDAASFWRHVGLREPAAAECFDRAEAAGCTSPDLAAYRAWMKDWAGEGKEAAK